MSHVPAHVPFELSGTALRDAVVQYATAPIYHDNPDWLNHDNPYRRQLRPQVLPHLDLTAVPGRGDILNYPSLAVQRLLTSIYEADLVLLPKSGLRGREEDFRAFYSPANRALGERVRPALERYAYGFLDEEVETSGAWTAESLDAWLDSLDTGGAEPPAPWEKAVRGSADPRRAARMWLVQFAPDFLAEASPMIRNVLGAYGPAQSEWFKIVVDEYGYGVHDTKHSTLFERTLESVGLESDLHRYWQYYLNSSLLLNNYFHYLGKNHELFFRYVGALYYTESSLVDFCRRADRLLRDVFGDTVDTAYFTEHVHIDQHHGRMARDKIIKPLVEAHGEGVIPEIVRGIAEYRVLLDVFDFDFAEQIDWMDAQPELKKLHGPVFEGLARGLVDAPVAHLVEPRGELSNTHCHDGDELCHIVSGTMRFESGLGSSLTLRDGEGVVIRRNRLHGADILSDECVYEIHSVGDHRACLS
jgi:hypothetical protein